MKKVFTLVILISFFISNSNAQVNYTLANSGIASNFSAYNFIVKSPTEVYVVGGMLSGNMFIGGAIYKLVNEVSWSQEIINGLAGYKLFYSSGIAGDKMFLCARKTVWQYDILSSTNGKDWKLSENGIPVNYVTSAFIARSADTIFAFGTLLDSVNYNHTRSIYRSIDSGNTWNKLTTYGLNVSSGFRTAAIIGNKIMLTTGFNVYVSLDGIIWNLSQFGLPSNFETYGLAVLSDKEVYASGGIWSNNSWSPAIYKSTDGGVTWSEHSYSGLPYSNYPLHTACFTGNKIFQSLVTGNLNYSIYSSDVSVSINEPIGQSRSVAIFPNPASDIVTIFTPLDGLKIIELYDSKGSLIFTNTTINDKIDLPISKLKSGIYYSIVKGNEGIITGKFIKE